MIEIDKGIPIPDAVSRHKRPGKPKGTERTYPFRSMEIGDSFKAPSRAICREDFDDGYY